MPADLRSARNLAVAANRDKLLQTAHTLNVLAGRPDRAVELHLLIGGQHCTARLRRRHRILNVTVGRRRLRTAAGLAAEEWRLARDVAATTLARSRLTTVGARIFILVGAAVMLLPALRELSYWLDPARAGVVLGVVLEMLGWTQQAVLIGASSVAIGTGLRTMGEREHLADAAELAATWGWPTPPHLARRELRAADPLGPVLIVTGLGLGAALGWAGYEAWHPLAGPLVTPTSGPVLLVLFVIVGAMFGEACIHQAWAAYVTARDRSNDSPVEPPSRTGRA